MFKKIDKSKVVDFEGGKFISNSGIYEEVLVKNVILSKEEGKATTIPLWVNYNGQDQLLKCGINVFNRNGDDNPIGQELLNEICIVAGLEGHHELGNPDEEITIKAGKDNTNITVPVYDIEPFTVTMRIQKNWYRGGDGEIYSSKNLKKAYTDDTKATAAELLSDNSETHGTQYKKALEYSVEDSYSGVTVEEVEAKKAGSTGSKKTPSKLFNAPKDTGVKKSVFGK